MRDLLPVRVAGSMCVDDAASRVWRIVHIHRYEVSTEIKACVGVGASVGVRGALPATARRKGTGRQGRLSELCMAGRCAERRKRGFSESRAPSLDILRSGGRLCHFPAKVSRMTKGMNNGLAGSCGLEQAW